MLETLKYITNDNKNKKHDVVVYGLSTCGFCKKAMSWLDQKNIQYRYIYLDYVPIEVKVETKKILKEKFKETVAFPFTVIDDEKHLVGFIEANWVKIFKD